MSSILEITSKLTFLSFDAGFGPFLSLDEFFFAPSQTLSFPANAGLLESLVYFLEDPQPEPSQSNHPADDLPSTSETPNLQNPEPSDEVDQPRHGMQLFFRSAFQPVVEKGGQIPPSQENVSHWPIVNHGREAAFVPESREGNGAEVKVIAGGYGRVTSGPPLDRFVSLAPPPSVYTTSAFRTFSHKAYTSCFKVASLHYLRL
jgi:hypothetical protein